MERLGFFGPLDHFECVPWAGLELGCVAWATVSHRDEYGGAHVHVLTACVELETCKSHDLAPHGQERSAARSS